MSSYVVVAAALLVFVVVVVAAIKNLGKGKLPPSPPSLPFVGHLHLVGELPHRSLDALHRRYGSDGGLMFLRLGRAGALVVSTAAAAADLYRGHDLAFASRPPSHSAERLFYGGRNMSFAPLGDAWRRTKKLAVAHLLSPRRARPRRRGRRARRPRSPRRGGGAGRPAQGAPDIMGAATDTSFVTLEWIMTELIRNTQVMSKLQNEIIQVTGSKPTVTEEDLTKLDYLKAVIKEVLRLHPPAPLLIPHHSTMPTTIQGYHIPAKTIAFINVWAIGRDPAAWDTPDEFRPERFMGSAVDFRGNDYKFIPFGAGRRLCPGIILALPGLEMVIASLLYHFDWELPDGMDVQDLDMAEAPGLTTPPMNPGDKEDPDQASAPPPLPTDLPHSFFDDLDPYLAQLSLPDSVAILHRLVLVLGLAQAGNQTGFCMASYEPDLM
ncbi:Os09g0530275 [Oryza sativa Japonica Group]|uniref:Os09g0530275 protein n=1 Tax=Oryza sativa subsp. japonica TaxID=39947 RepID=A0A0P0XPF8_ORYSJ|nr:hypothetical protein EE612_049099 [Oryza sativa]BAT09089.1 Os09g0530275 [Oryza sativa Japonica Group]